MADYAEMYYELFRATEKAVNLLIDAQRRCEEMYINSPDPEILVLPPQDSEEK